MKQLLRFLAPIALAGAAWATPPAPYLPVPRGAAVILDTGSTNTAAYRIVVTESGQATSVLAGRASATSQIGADLASRLFTDLRAGMPLSQLRLAPCMKSASFGSSRFVWWRGQRSPDITCPGAPAISRDVLDIATAVFGSAAPLKGSGAGHSVAPLPNEPRLPLPSPTASGSR